MTPSGVGILGWLWIAIGVLTIIIAAGIWWAER